MDDAKNLVWHKVLENIEDLPDGRVMSVNAAHRDICLTHHQGKFSGLDNKCPHQGGPLGEGSIENGLLRCPWHGWDFDPQTGQSPGFHDDSIITYPIDIRDDGIYVGIEEEEQHETTVSDIMVETMINAGVTHVFGMVGHSNLGVADAMRRQEKKGNLTYIAIRHEGAASFAVSAYGKLTGRPAACFAIAGPGATNLFTGLWDAKNDRAPVLALTGQVDTQVVGTGAFQEVDLVAAFSAVADFNHRVLHNSKHAELMVLAVKHAILDRSVSHITFPDEVQIHKVPDAKPATTTNRIANVNIVPPIGVTSQAIEKLKSAKRPVIIVGHGSRFHMKEVIEFAEMLNAPVLTTFKGKGLIPDHHPLGCGVLGRSGTPIASWVMNEADLLCVFGASFSNHTGITSKIPTIQVDFDKMALAKFHKIDVPVWGEISATVDIFTEALKDEELAAVDQRPDIAQRWELWKAEKANRLNDDHGQGISSIAVFEMMNKLVPHDAVMTVDVGNNAYSFGRYFETNGQDFLMSGYLGSIGFAFPAAMGAWAAVGDSRPVIAVAGDGGFVQYLGEITTAVKYKMPIKLILLNNSELGKISKEQRAANFDVWQTSLVNPNFADYANSCGAFGLRVTRKDDLEAGMKKVLEQEGPAMLEVITDVSLI